MKRLRSRSPARKTINQSINPFTNKQYSNKYRKLREEREKLPIFDALPQFDKMFNKNQVVILQGETGSGKTTQIPQYILEKGYAKGKLVACTQPRRVAAMSVAKRVAEEMDVELGQQVGYSIRFEECAGPNTLLKYLTDGMLLREAMTDPTLDKYGVIILDEAHERTLSTDILFGLLKEVLQKRKDLKVVVMSATLDTEKFLGYFKNAPLLTVPGRLYPVELFYTEFPEEDYLWATVRTVMQIHAFEEPGDILVFLTGEEEIESTCDSIRKEAARYKDNVGKLSVIPLYSSLPPAMQQKIFEPAPEVNSNGIPGRKCILSTNIAETSLTIDGIVFVIDSGLSKQKCYNPRMRVESLLVSPISRASAKQRAGRAGRTRPGKCYRLYTEKSYKRELVESTAPEILRSNLANVVLQLKILGIENLVDFDFIDPPSPETMMRALETLHYLRALDDEGELTEEGRLMSEFPLDPELSKLLIISPKYSCGEEMLNLVAMLTSPNPFLRPRDHEDAADKAKSKFVNKDGDHITLINAYQGFENEGRQPYWCSKNFLNPRTMRGAAEIRDQLVVKMNKLDIPIISNKHNISENIRKCIISGFFMQVVHKEKANFYMTLKEKQHVALHPSTGVMRPDWAVYHEYVLTSKKYIRIVSSINPEWLIEIAPQYFDLSHFPDTNGKKLLQEIIDGKNTQK
ncbi:unnamed protein product [Blepharisma stoltei]|uniref:RNA helicase n=1 Tax=Blepharisma stoltei TaxID=1481888 RepID=A0AAU9K741_9CILI|nr:unnamed protein product [Blepharisma stoltei]